LPLIFNIQEILLNNLPIYKYLKYVIHVFLSYTSNYNYQKDLYLNYDKYVLS